MKISTRTNLNEFVAHLTELEKKQIPFATSRALNDVAKQMQARVIDATESNFDNSKKWYRAGSPIGIKVHRSSKQDLTAGVYTKAPFGVLQEDGGIKTATQSRNLAIPLQDIPKKYQRNKPGLSGARRAMQDKGRRPAFVTIGKRSGKLGIFRRKTKNDILYNYCLGCRFLHVQKKDGDFEMLPSKKLGSVLSKHFISGLSKPSHRCVKRQGSIFHHVKCK